MVQRLHTLLALGAEMCLGAGFQGLGGQSRTTKIAALVDALGNLVRFVLLPGQRDDSPALMFSMAGVARLALIGDKAVKRSSSEGKIRSIFDNIPERFPYLLQLTILAIMPADIDGYQGGYT